MRKEIHSNTVSHQCSQLSWFLLYLPLKTCAWTGSPAPQLPPYSPGYSKEGGIVQRREDAPGAEWDQSTHLSLLDADFAEPHRVWAAVGGLHSTLGADILGTKHSPVHTQICQAWSCRWSGEVAGNGGNEALFSLGGHKEIELSFLHLPSMTKAS